MSDWSANLKLPYLATGQAQKHVPHNEALELLDSIVQLSVVEFDAGTPPLAPNDGNVWTIGLGGMNEWAGHESQLAIWSNGGWLFVTPSVGWCAALEDDLRVCDGAVWVAPAMPDLQNLPGVGIGASHDATLLSHGGADLRRKINDAGVSDTASMLFRSNWSGRAEFGTMADDSFALKVSADESAWTDGLVVNTADGAVTVPAAAGGSPGTAAPVFHAHMRTEATLVEDRAVIALAGTIGTARISGVRGMRPTTSATAGIVLADLVVIGR